MFTCAKKTGLRCEDLQMANNYSTAMPDSEDKVA